MHERTEHWEALVIERDGRNERFERSAIELDAVGSRQTHVVGAAGHHVALTVRVVRVDHAALTDHRVEVEFLLKAFPELQRKIVEADVLGRVIRRADVGGVASDVAQTDRPLFEHGHIGDAEVIREVVGRSEPMTTAADDDYLVLLAGFGLAPCRLPATMTGEGFAEQAQRGVATT